MINDFNANNLEDGEVIQVYKVKKTTTGMKRTKPRHTNPYAWRLLLLSGDMRVCERLGAPGQARTPNTTEHKQTNVGEHCFIHPMRLLFLKSVMSIRQTVTADKIN